MKKIIFVIITSLVCSFTSYAQQEKIGVDGLTLGMSRPSAIYCIENLNGNFALKNKSESNRWMEYQSNSGLITYTLYYDTSNTIYKIVKSSITFVADYIEEIYNSAYADIYYNYGEPLIQGNSSVIWRGKNYKIELSYGSAPFPTGSTKYTISANYQTVK